jgi:hypothetical protein
MFSTTYTPTRTAEQHQSAPSRTSAASDVVLPEVVGAADDKTWADTTQICAWTASMAMSGYGPAGSSFV